MFEIDSELRSKHDIYDWYEFSIDCYRAIHALNRTFGIGELGIRSERFTRHPRYEPLPLALLIQSKIDHMFQSDLVGVVLVKDQTDLDLDLDLDLDQDFDLVVVRIAVEASDLTFDLIVQVKVEVDIVAAVVVVIDLDIEEGVGSPSF